MIRRSPAEKYIEYLLVHPDALSDEAILELLQLQQLDFIGPKYLARLRDALHPPTPFKPENTLHRLSVRFLNAHRLFYKFHPDAAMLVADKILGSPRAKEAIESMLIVREHSELIARRLAHVGVQATAAAVERYRFYYFNIDLVDSSELQALLKLRTAFLAPGSDPYEVAAQAALQKTYGDPRVQAASRPTSQMAAIMQRLRMGQLPGRLDVAKLLQVGKAAALIRAADTLTNDFSANSSEATRNWALAAKAFNEMLQEEGRADEALLEELQQLSLKTDSAEVPHIHELTSGNHTLDLQPSPEVPENVDLQ